MHPKGLAECSKASDIILGSDFLYRAGMVIDYSKYTKQVK